MTASLMEVWDCFAAERAPSLCPTSRGTDWNQARVWLNRCPVQDLDRAREVLVWILSQEPPQAALRVAMFYRGMCRWASSPDIGILDRNPVQSFKMPKAPQKADHEVVVIPTTEVPTVINGMKPSRKGCTPWHLWTEFQYQTGMRTGEVRALKWDDLRGDNAFVHANWPLSPSYYKPSTKTNRTRMVPLNSRVHAVLEQLPRDNEFIFPWQRETFQSVFRQRMQKLYDAGRIKKIYRPYDLRHSAISEWLARGIPLALAARWAGNTRDVLVRNYCGVVDELPIPEL